MLNKTFLCPQHSCGKSTALKHFCGLSAAKVTIVERRSSIPGISCSPQRHYLWPTTTYWN